jgi:hypothetical protein
VHIVTAAARLDNGHEVNDHRYLTNST